MPPSRFGLGVDGYPPSDMPWDCPTPSCPPSDNDPVRVTQPGDSIDTLRCAECHQVYPEHHFIWVDPDHVTPDSVIDLTEQPAGHPRTRGNGTAQL